jgi:hypothetical protein
MPQAPIIIPLIITGLFFGSLLKHRAKSISKKSVAIASVAAGLLNGVHAYLLDIMSPQPTTTFTTRASFALQPAATVPFVISAIGVGILIVLLVIGVAAIYRRFSRGTEEEEPVTEEKPADETLG